MNVYRTLVAALALVAVTAGLATHGPTLAASAHAKTVIVKAVNQTSNDFPYAFSPKRLTVAVGTKVVWQNPSDAPHTVTFVKNKVGVKFDKKLNQGKSVTFTFTKKGVYSYYCVYHPYMRAKVIVK